MRRLVCPADRRARATNTLLAMVLLWLLPTVIDAMSASTLEGRLRIVGSRSMQAPVTAWMTQFARQHPNVDTHTALYGSSWAAGAIATDHADVAPLTRPFDPVERAMLSDRPPTGIKVGADAEARPMFLYVARDAAGRADPAAIAFVRVALSSEGQASLAAQGYAALLPADRTAAADHLNRLAGTD